MWKKKRPAGVLVRERIVKAGTLHAYAPAFSGGVLPRVRRG